MNRSKTIYLAGGCFWGIGRFFRMFEGVTGVTAGYANGRGEEYANYEAVCTGETGFRETVKVDYDPGEISLEEILTAYYARIDPTDFNRQGLDVGTQYQTGIYWTDPEDKETVMRISNAERERHTRFYVELKPLENFFPAEGYHQEYLCRN